MYKRQVGDFGILDKNRQYAIFVEAEERINLLRLKERIVDGRAYVSLADYFDSTEHLLSLIHILKAGETFTEENVRSIRPGYGLPPKFLKEVLGRKSARDIKFGTPLSWDCIS